MTPFIHLNMFIEPDLLMGLLTDEWELNSSSLGSGLKVPVSCRGRCAERLWGMLAVMVVEEEGNRF